MMACPDMQTESTFLQVLQKVDNYAIKDDTLSLQKARMAPLAKFKWVVKEK
jgi:heat shock protein HslJ